MNEENRIVPINENKDIELELDETINIEKLIYNIRGKHVMLDSDVERLYHY